MSPALFESVADGMLLRHATRVAPYCTTLDVLAEWQPVRWSLMVEWTQDAILAAYQSGSIRLLRDILAMVEKIYRDAALSCGMDPDTGMPTRG